MLTNCCAAFGYPLDHVLHDMSLAEVFALNACNAWGQGMEPTAETYEDRELNAILATP